MEFRAKRSSFKAKTYPHIRRKQLNSCVIVHAPQRRGTETRLYGGEGGIRTLDGLLTHTPLAGARLQPLGHLSKNSFLYKLVWVCNPYALGRGARYSELRSSPCGPPSLRDDVQRTVYRGAFVSHSATSPESHATENGMLTSRGA